MYYGLLFWYCCFEVAYEKHCCIAFPNDGNFLYVGVEILNTNHQSGLYA